MFGFLPVQFFATLEKIIKYARKVAKTEHGISGRVLLI